MIRDLKMPGMGGLELLEKITEREHPVLTVIMTGFGTVETAIEAMKKGAYDYLLKPFKVEEVIHVVERGLDRQRLQPENIRLREALSHLQGLRGDRARRCRVEKMLDVVLDATHRRGQGRRRDAAARGSRAARATSRADAQGRRERAEPDVEAPALNLNEVLPHFREDLPLLAQAAAARYASSRRRRTIWIGAWSASARVPLKVRERMIGMLNVYSYTRGNKFDEGQRKMLSVLASRAAVSIENARLYEELVDANKDLTRANSSLEENFQQTVVGFAQALEETDRYTRGHSERVAVYARLIARGLTLPEPEIDAIVKAGLMHDVGKIGMRYDKLNKPGKLTPEEVAVFRQHPAKGKRILEPMPCMHGIVPAAGATTSGTAPAIRAG